MKSEQIKEITERATEQLVAALKAGRSELLTAYGQKTRPDRCPAPEIIALRTLMINQAWEVSCLGRFPASLNMC